MTNIDESGNHCKKYGHNVVFIRAHIGSKFGNYVCVGCGK